MNIFIIYICYIIVTFTSLVLAQKNILCYYGSWATYREGNAKFDVSHIDPNLCTHLMYAFFSVENNGEFKVLNPYLDLEDNYGLGNIKKFNNLKKKNRKLKTLAAVGGWTEGSKKFSQLAKDSKKRQRFIKSSVNFILKHGFDGLDMDWEYPAQRDGDSKVDKQNFVILLKELKQELKKHKLLLSAAVAAPEFSAEQSYNIKEISKYLDLINIMAYDFNGPFGSKVGINAPLYAGPADNSSFEQQLNVDAAIKYWLKKGAPASKINMGIPFYGRTFTLKNSNQNTVGSPHNGPGQQGKYTKEAGLFGYNEICENLNSGNWIKKWQSQQLVPYAYKGNQWVGYDDEKSIREKIRFLKKNNLSGVKIWSIDTDDFRGICGIKFPLLKKINQCLKSDNC